MASNIKCCHNCGSTSHFSINCPKEQQYNRCPTCANVCFNENGHKRTCGNVAFRSVLKTRFERVVEIKRFLELQFEEVDDIVVRFGDTFKRIGPTPLWLPEHSLHLVKTDNLVHVEGDPAKNYTVAIMDSNGNRRIKFVVGREKIIINDRYICDIHGNIKYNMFAEDVNFGYANCTLQVDNYHDNKAVKVHAKWKQISLHIDGYTGGAILVDPLHQFLRTAEQGKILYERFVY